MFSVRKWASLAVAALLVAGCADQTGPTAPPAAATSPASQSLVSTLLGSPTKVNIVTRNVALKAPVSASKTVGILGGTISVPGTGLTVVVPALAVTKSTKITVTAVAGNKLAYEFAPHGIKFVVPLIVTQSMKGTSAESAGLLSSPLSAGYFSSTSALDPKSATGLVTEILSAALSLPTKTLTWPVFHFSGYLVLTGRSSGFTADEAQ